MTFEELKEQSYQKIRYHHVRSQFELRRLILINDMMKIKEMIEETQNENSLDEVIEIVDNFYDLENKKIIDEIKKEADKILKTDFMDLFGDKIKWKEDQETGYKEKNLFHN